MTSSLNLANAEISEWSISPMKHLSTKKTLTVVIQTQWLIRHFKMELKNMNIHYPNGCKCRWKSFKISQSPYKIWLIKCTNKRWCINRRKKLYKKSFFRSKFLIIQHKRALQHQDRGKLPTIRGKFIAILIKVLTDQGWCLRSRLNSLSNPKEMSLLETNSDTPSRFHKTKRNSRHSNKLKEMLKNSKWRNSTSIIGALSSNINTGHGCLKLEREHF